VVDGHKYAIDPPAIERVTLTAIAVPLVLESMNVDKFLYMPGPPLTSFSQHRYLILGCLTFHVFVLCVELAFVLN